MQPLFHLLNNSFTCWTNLLAAGQNSPVGLLFYLSGQNSTYWTTVLPVGHLFYLLDNCTTTTCWTKLNLLDNCSTCWTAVLPVGQNSTCGTTLITVRQKHYLLDNSSTCWPKQILRKSFPLSKSQWHAIRLFGDSLPCWTFTVHISCTSTQCKDFGALCEISIR